MVGAAFGNSFEGELSGSGAGFLHLGPLNTIMFGWMQRNKRHWGDLKDKILVRAIHDDTLPDAFESRVRICQMQTSSLCPMASAQSLRG